MAQVAEPMCRTFRRAGRRRSEGLQKKQENLAEEVAKVAGGQK